MIPEGLQDDTVDDSTDYSDGGYSQLIADYNEDDTQETIVVPPSLEAPKRASTPEPTKQEIPVALGKRTFAEAKLAESPSSNARSPKKQHMSNVKLSHSTSPSTPRRSMVDIVTDALREQPDTNNASSSSRRQSVPNAIMEARRPEPRTPSHNTRISPSSRPSDSRYPDHRSSANKASIETPESLPLPHIPRPSSPENQMPVASEFPPFEIVAHDELVQKRQGFRNLPWGVRWEIGRLIMQNKLKVEDLTPERLESLQGSNEIIAPLVEQKLKNSTPRVSAHLPPPDEQAKGPWRALDREEAVFKRDDQFGHPVNEVSAPDLQFRYHGRVQFAGRLTFADKKNKSGKLRFILEKPDLGSSSRFTRRFGSDWLIRIRYNRDIRSSRVYEFCIRPLIIFDRIYRAFYASKDQNIFFAATNETFINGEVVTIPETSRRFSLHSLLQWHNPIELNNNQTIAKWAARIPLGLSNSVPGPKLECNQIRLEPEIISSSWNPSTGLKPPSEMEMTDGCGFINQAALEELHSNKFWDTIPVAIQVRVAGNKGLLTRHPSNDANDLKYPCIWVRPSQTKIHYSDQDLAREPAKRTIDVLRASHMRSGIQASKEILVNFAENGVPHDVLSRRMRESLEELMEQLLQWDDMLQLSRLVFKEGGILGARMAREVAGEARVRGYRAYDNEDDDKEEDERISEVLELGPERSKAWQVDEISGLPSSLEETVCYFLDSGFTPQNNVILAEKLKEVITKAMKKRIARCRVEIPMSCSAWIIPDPTGTLKEGEIHIKSSGPNLKGQDGELTEQVLGPVLVSRHPCKLPTDVQKVTAVYYSQLKKYVDVIVFSTKGRRSLASMLGTGDYDGDKVEAVWDPEITGPFRNADPKFADPPPDLMKNFKKQNETVEEFLKRTAKMSPEQHMEALQTILLGALHDPSVVGIYSCMHDNSIYVRGYAHPETERLGNMFAWILDGGKTGLTVDEEVRKKDFADLDCGSNVIPLWKTWSTETLKHGNTSNKLARRTKGPFIIDFLQSEAQKIYNQWVPRVSENFAALRKTRDEDLIKPYYDALNCVERSGVARMAEELKMIEKHVHDARILSGKMMKLSSELALATLRDTSSPPLQANRNGKAPFTRLPIEIRQDILKAHSKHFVSSPEPSTMIFFRSDEIAQIRASYAYIHDWEMKMSRHPWNVSMRVLCEIKAKASKNYKVLTGTVYEHMSIPKAAVKT